MLQIITKPKPKPKLIADWRNSYDFDAYIENLGTYFTTHNIQERTGLTFDAFVRTNMNDEWSAETWL